MADEVERNRYLDQQTAVYEIASRFGEEFTYSNAHGNAAIRADVLKRFRELTGDTVVWERGQRLWRMREAHDEHGRTQRS